MVMVLDDPSGLFGNKQSSFSFDTPKRDVFSLPDTPRDTFLSFQKPEPTITLDRSPQDTFPFLSSTSSSLGISTDSIGNFMREEKARKAEQYVAKDQYNAAMGRYYAEVRGWLDRGANGLPPCCPIDVPNPDRFYR